MPAPTERNRLMYAIASTNPHYAARLRRATPARPSEPGGGQSPRRDEPEPALYARLPRAPRTASPVPHLTSLYHNSEGERGQYGRKDYPGNCSGHLIKDLLTYFKPGLVLDPMSGGGTCEDVCKEM